MFRFFRFIINERAYQRAFNEALQLSKSGKKYEAFEKFQSLLQDHPTDVYLRRQILLLGTELHVEVLLPSLKPKGL